MDGLRRTIIRKAEKVRANAREGERRGIREGKIQEKTEYTEQ